MPGFNRRRVQSLLALVLLASGSVARAEGSKAVDEVLLRPRRLSSEGRRQYELGNHPEALKSFESAARVRPADPVARFDLADALYKNGKFDQAEEVYRSLAADARSPLAAPSRFNLGNVLYQKQDFPGAIGAYRDALRLTPQAADARKNLELALRALQKQQQQQDKNQKKDDRQNQDQNNQQQRQQQDKQDKQGQDQRQPQGQPSPKPKTEDEKEQERFQKEAGMPRERAMQLLDALQRDEKTEQKRLLARQARKRPGKDW
jgi:Ca-activated chloride channel homolog